MKENINFDVQRYCFADAHTHSAFRRINVRGAIARQPIFRFIFFGLVDAGIGNAVAQTKKKRDRLRVCQTM